MLTRTSLTIHVAAAIIGAAIALCFFYYHPTTAPKEGPNLFATACGVSTSPASWLSVHFLPHRYFYDYFWLTPPPDLGPPWVPVVVLAVVNSLLSIAASMAIVCVIRYS